MSEFSFASYNNILWLLDHAPQRKLGLSLWILQDPGEDSGSEEGLLGKGNGAAVASRAHACSCFSLLMKFHGVTDDLPPIHAMHPAVNWAALHAGVFKKTSTDLVIYRKHFGGGGGGVTLSLTTLGLNKASRNAYYNCSLVAVQQWCRAQFGAALMHTSQAALPVPHWVMRKL